MDRPLRLSAEDGKSPYVCFAAQDWWYHNQSHSDFQLMRHIAQTRRVLVVNSIGMRMPLPGRSTEPLRRILRKARSVARLIQAPLDDLPNFHVMSPLVAPFYGQPAIRTLNAWAVAAQVRLACAYLRMRRPICVVTLPTAEPVVTHMAHRSLVVNRSDKYSAFSEADGEYIAQLEERLLSRADHVLYASRALMAAEMATADGRAHFVDHGVDVEHFRRRPLQEEPADLRDIPHPRLGFFGSLDSLVDTDLIEHVASQLPETQVVLIGTATVSTARLERLPNVHLLGSRPYEEIPRYGSGFDVALMPWKSIDWIRWCNPIKLKEYLALGLPVVSTPFPELTHYEGFVRVAATPEGFVAQVRAALAPSRTHDDDGAARRARVADDTWDARAQEIIELAEGVTAA
jgi:glycosyltransferase involved in cell wall biosynthesis